MILYRQNYRALAHVPKPRQRKPILSIRARAEGQRSRRRDAPRGDASPAHELLRRIESVIQCRDLPAAVFGQQALNNPNFVFDLRQGRRIREGTRQKIAAILDQREGSV